MEEMPNYVIVQRPGMVPDRKGPLYDKKQIEEMLRGLYECYPDCECTVIQMPHTSYPGSGREWLDMYGDKRRKRIARPRVEKYRGLLLWALYHHQGGSSEVGQPIRRALGIGRHERLTEDQIETAKKAAGVAGHDYPACALFRGGGKCTCDANEPQNAGNNAPPKAVAVD